MINIIKADFYRVFKSIAIYIGIVVMLFIIGTSIYAVQPGEYRNYKCKLSEHKRNIQQCNERYDSN